MSQLAGNGSKAVACASAGNLGQALAWSGGRRRGLTSPSWHPGSRPRPSLTASFAGPLFDEMPVGAEGGARTSRLIMTILADPAEEVRSWTGPAEGTVRDRYLAAFGRALPGLSTDELWFRMRGILAVVAVDRVEVYNQPTPGCMTPVAGEAARRWAIIFLTAAMSAPPTGT